MGSGKGSVEYWVSEIQPGKMLFEIGGIAPELAQEAMRLAAAKLPVKTVFIARTVL
jgi:large subunit ribosomal protein L16